MPPMPKPAATRQRRNKVAGATKLTLRTVKKGDIPSLPFDTHEMTSRWWVDIWSSPMAPEWDTSDIHGLYMLARLVDAFWTAESATQASTLAGEIRLQAQRFGLSPIDRRRLQWEIDRGDEAEQRTTARRQQRKPGPKKVDPRLVLEA